MKKKQSKASAFKLLCSLHLWSPHEDLTLLTSLYPLYHPPLPSSPPPPDVDSVLNMRKDLRALKVYTIDGPGANEIDDGITLQILPNGTQRIWVHISDATNLATSSDIEGAKMRRTSLYLPQRTLGMFNGWRGGGMSLEERKDCRGVSMCVEIDESGSIKSVDVMCSWVRVSYALTFDEVDEMIEEGIAFNEEWQIGALLKIANVRAGHRLRNNSTESRITTPLPQGLPVVKSDRLSPDGVQVGIKLEETSSLSGSKSKLIVTEIMILANEAMGLYCSQNSIPAPYRTQTPPQYSTRPVEHATLKNLKEKNLHLPAAWYERRFFSPAIISNRPGLHAGLGVEYYVQWTSPIRRYSDFEVHNNVKRYLRMEKVRGILEEGERIPEEVKSDDLGCVFTGVDDECQAVFTSCDEDANKGMIEEARSITKGARKYWVLEYIKRANKNHFEDFGKTRVWDLMCLGRIESGSVVYVKEIGYEFVWAGEEFEVGEEFRGWVERVDPRFGELNFKEWVGE
ncbi:hypothetical protein TrVE_jg13112 [Triparma verrucosa]|uniref:DIS3-like exonuclease 1 n=3 Tax=Triparma TaxID=722752 RepID=A0A9W6ZN63_9STRA|nr:hypothetical protein TrST_g4659 [Triparma strigata]GMI07625.1 hypothetical protein TrVE_jg13112 [Triparma verrucosa]